MVSLDLGVFALDSATDFWGPSVPSSRRLNILLRVALRPDVPCPFLSVPPAVPAYFSKTRFANPKNCCFQSICISSTTYVKFPAAGFLSTRFLYEGFYCTSFLQNQLLAKTCACVALGKYTRYNNFITISRLTLFSPLSN